MNTNEQPNHTNSSADILSAVSPTSSRQPPAAPQTQLINPTPPESPMARNAAAYLASALERLAAAPADIQSIIRPYIEKHFPDSNRPRQPINFDVAKANCIQTRLTHELAAKQKREAAEAATAAVEQCKMKNAQFSMLNEAAPAPNPVDLPKSPIALQPAPITPPKPGTPPGTTSGTNPVQSQRKTEPTPAQTQCNPAPGAAPDAPHNSHSSQTSQPSHPTSQAEAEIAASEQTLARLKAAQSLLDCLPPFGDGDPFALTPETPEIAAQLEAEISERLNNHPLSPLDQLSHEKQELLYDLLQDHNARRVAKVITQPAPLGWGIQTSASSLVRFETRFEKRTRHQQHTQAKKLTRQILADTNAEGAEPDYDRATEVLFKQYLVDLANQPESNPKHYRDMLQISIRLRHTHLAEKRLALAEQKKQP